MRDRGSFPDNAGFQEDGWKATGCLVSLSLRLKDLLGPVTRVKKKKEK